MTVVVVLLLVVFGYRHFFASPVAAVTYQTAQAKIGTLVVSLSESGSVSSADSAAVTTGAGGVVSGVYVKEGDQVREGQALAAVTLDQSSRQIYDQAMSSYLSTKDNLASARNELNTLQNTMFVANQKFINDAVARNLSVTDPTYIEENAAWLAAENNYTNQQTAISQAQQAFDSASMSLRQVSPVIYAPISGRISSLSVGVGTVITSSGSSSSASSSSNGSSSGTSIATISTDAPPAIVLNLTEIDAPKVKIGDQATVTLDAFPGSTFTGRITDINTVGTVSSGVTTYPATLVLSSPDTAILPNMSATADIILQTRSDVLLVPVGAVHTSNGVSTVQVLQNNIPHQVVVRTGLQSDTQVEITSGLQAGQTVVTGTTGPSSGSVSSGQSSPFSVFGGGRGGGAARLGR